ncbi:MAG: hypothetical protein OER90_20960 [Gemmatimonadota bacterium]|nr:hypothetical protein [Gemmatimonadota bacterium]
MRFTSRSRMLLLALPMTAASCSSTWTTTLRAPTPSVAEAHCIEYTLLQEPHIDSVATVTDTWHRRVHVVRPVRPGGAPPTGVAGPPPVMEIAFSADSGGGRIVQMVDAQRAPYITISWTWTAHRPSPGQVGQVEEWLLAYLRLMSIECMDSELTEDGLAFLHSWAEPGS